MGKNGGFNPFRDAQGRWADKPGPGGSGRSDGPMAALPPKVHFEQDGVRLEFTGGRTPRYRIVHGDNVVKEIEATTKWKRELAQMEEEALQYVSKVQYELANRQARELAGRKTPDTSDGVLLDLGKKARELDTPQNYRDVGKVAIAQIRKDPQIAEARETMARLVKDKAANPRQWTGHKQVEYNRAEWLVSDRTRQLTLDMLGRLYGETRPHDLNINPHSIQKYIEMAEEAIAFFPRPWVERAARGAQVTVLEEVGGGRSNYSDRGRINMARGAGRATMVHELGHYIEEFHPRLRKAAVDYRESRVKGEAAVPLSRFNGAYASHEMAKADRFVDPYMGKVYKGGETEIISMMFEDLSQGNWGVVTKDPAMYEWFVGVLISL